jgi:hypothetical protein
LYCQTAISEKPEDDAAFMRVVEETWEIVPLPIDAMACGPQGNFIRGDSSHFRFKRTVTD